MWSVEGETETAVPADVVWRTWTNADNWAKFDPAMEWVNLRPFAAGTKGTIKIKTQPRSSGLRISQLDESTRTFEIDAPLPLANLRIEHRVDPGADGGSRLWQRTSIYGLAAWFWIRVIGNELRAGLPSRLVSLAELAGQSQVADQRQVADER